jgi:uncharacterized protein (DUF433 family)
MKPASQRDAVSEWIVTDPAVLGGKPCVRGTRISVEFLLELLGSGATPGSILDAYPQITGDGLAAAFQYAAKSMKNEVIWDVKTPA